MCFGSGHLLYSVTPPQVCPRCKGKGTLKIKTKKNNSPYYWIKLLRRKGPMSSARFVLGWFSIIGITVLFAMLLGISYVWVFVK